MAGPTKHALLAKSREAALSAVQTYNNPLVTFKSESFIVLMTLAWLYLLHAYYAREQIDYRYKDNDPSTKRKYQRTPEGGFKWWDLSFCLRAKKCPLDTGTVNNLNFLIGLRNEIEHHRPPHLDDHMSGRYLACTLNFEYYMTELFGERHSLGDTVALALQFRDIQPTDTSAVVKLPSRLSSYIEKFEGGMTQEEFDDPRFAFRLLFTRKTANHKGQADRAIEFVKPGDPGSEDITPDRWLTKETEKPKYRRKDVFAMLKKAGYYMSPSEHTDLWHRLDAKNPKKGFGVEVAGSWYWYDKWVEQCKKHCQAVPDKRARAARQTKK